MNCSNQSVAKINSEDSPYLLFLSFSFQSSSVVVKKNVEERGFKKIGRKHNCLRYFLHGSGEIKPKTN